MFDLFKRDTKEEEDTCTGHHFGEVNTKSIELKRPESDLSIVLKETMERCQHENCWEERTLWEIDKFLYKGPSEMTNGGLYLNSTIQDLVEKITELQVTKRDIQRELRWGEAIEIVTEEANENNE